MTVCRATLQEVREVAEVDGGGRSAFGRSLLLVLMYFASHYVLRDKTCPCGTNRVPGEKKLKYFQGGDFNREWEKGHSREKAHKSQT